MIEAIVREMLLLVIAKIQLFVFDLSTKAQILICKFFFFFLVIMGVRTSLYAYRLISRCSEVND
jgi:hypothetical protein